MTQGFQPEQLHKKLPLCELGQDVGEAAWGDFQKLVLSC